MRLPGRLLFSTLLLFAPMQENKALIEGHGDCYVLRDGTVWKDGKQKVPIRKGNQALKVRMQTNKVVIEYGLATLVARAFLPNPEGYSKIVFRDGNKYNCAADNIAWVSNREFSRYSLHKEKPMEGRDEKVNSERSVVSDERGRREKLEKVEAAVVVDESWRVIPGTVGYYASARGEIYNPKGMLLKQMTAPNKGAWVKVKDKTGNRVMTTVAKLVALTYIPNPNWYERVIFRDRNKMNAAAENLMWVSEWDYRRWYRTTDNDLLGEARRPKTNKVERHPYSMPIQDFPGFYIAPDGTVYKGNRVIKPQCTAGRSIKVSLRVEGVVPKLSQVFGLAKLVARHFVPNPKRYKYVVFKDRNNRNCHRDNIAWVDGETFMWYSGLLQNPGRKKKMVLTQEEALQRCTHTPLLHYYKTLDESWLADVWSEIDAALGDKSYWKHYKSECYIYFMDRVKRFSILRNPLWLMRWYVKILHIVRRKEISDAMPIKLVVGTDECLRNVGEYE